MATSTLTASNTVITVTVPGVFDVPQQLQGFASDDIFSTEAVKRIETLMGVDGTLSAGYVPVPVVMRIMLQANSPSVRVFDQWDAGQQLLQDAYQAFGLITINNLGTKYVLVNGYMTSYAPIPDAKKIYQPRSFEITWNQVVPAQL